MALLRALSHTLQVRMWETVHHDCIRVLTGRRQCPIALARVVCQCAAFVACVTDGCVRVSQATPATSTRCLLLGVEFIARATTRQSGFGSSVCIGNNGVLDIAQHLRNLIFIHVHHM